MNEYTPSGMKQLTSETVNELTKLKASVSITWSGVLKALNTKAAKKYAKTKKDEDKTPLSQRESTQKTSPTAKMLHASRQLATKRK